MDDGLNRALVFGSQIFAVLLVVMGAALQQSELRSARPPAPAGQVAQYDGQGDRYARLWEDPLDGFQTYKPKGSGSDESSIERIAKAVEALTKMVEPKVDAPKADAVTADATKADESPTPPEGNPEQPPYAQNINIPPPNNVEPVADTRILWNVIDASPTPEAKEVRLRARYATTTALAALGYEPDGDSTIREVTAPDNWQRRGQEGNSKPLVAFRESFKLRSDSKSRKLFPNAILVYWHPQQLEFKRPILDKDVPFYSIDTPTKVVDILSDITARDGVSSGLIKMGRTRFNQVTHVLNYGSSSILRLFQAKKLSEEEVNNVHFIRATIPSFFLNSSSDPNEKVALPSRSVMTDDKLVEALVDELKYRIPSLADESIAPFSLSLTSAPSIDNLPKSENSKVIVAVVDSKIHIRIFNSFGKRVIDKSEMELRSGRELDEIKALLPTEFSSNAPELPDKKARQIIRNARICSGQIQPERILIVTESDGEYGDNLRKLFSDTLGCSATIEVQGYLRGLDGLSSENESAARNRSNTNEDSKQFIQPAGGFTEKSWGTSQYDYLRRLSASLGKRGSHGRGQLIAIGVLGTDIYDKLLVMQALHSAHPDILYFTTDLDSLYLSRDHLPFTRNLVIASGEELELSYRRSLGSNHGISEFLNKNAVSIPPMRDCYQTALIHTIYNIVTDNPTEIAEARSATLWEVGSGTFVPLDRGTPEQPGAKEPPKRPLHEFLMLSLSYPKGNIFLFLFSLVNAVFMLLSILVMNRKDGASEGDGASRALRMVSTLVAFSIGTVILTYLVFLYSKLQVQHAYMVAAAFSGLLILLWGIRKYIRQIPKWRAGGPSLPKLMASSVPPPDRSRAIAGGCFWTELIAACLVALGLTTAVIGTFLPNGSENTLAGESLSPVMGIAIWPSVLLRVVAFGIGLALLYKTIQRLFGRRKIVQDDLGKVAILLINENEQKNRVMKRVSDTLEPGTSFWPAIGCSVIYFGLSMFLFMIWPSYIPGRGGICLAAEKLSLSLGVGLYIIHLWFCLVLHYSSFKTIAMISNELMRNKPVHIDNLNNRINTDRLNSIDGGNTVRYSSALEYQKVVLDGCDRVSHGVQKLTKYVGVTLLYPLAILSLLLISRLRIFDDWNMMPSLLITFLFGALVLLFSSILLLNVSRALRRNLTGFLGEIADLFYKEIAEAEVEVVADPKGRAVQTAKSSLDELKLGIERLRTTREGAFAPWYGQPIFVAILSALAVIGSTNLVGPLTSLFFK